MKRMLHLWCACALALSCAASLSRADEDEGKIRVAVIDTGIHSSLMNQSFLCKRGHRDFTGTSLNDNVGHGTHVSGLIDQYVKSIYLDRHPISALLSKRANYCQIIIKTFDPKFKGSTLESYLRGLRYAISLKVDYINYSGGGVGYSYEEEIAIKEALSRNITVVAAAGNNSSDISKHPHYPAVLDSRVVVVGSITREGKRAPYSNYGSSVDVYEIGHYVVSLRTASSLAVLSGTSQATAVHTGKLIRQRLSRINISSSK